MTRDINIRVKTLGHSTGSRQGRSKYGTTIQQENMDITFVSGGGGNASEYSNIS